MGQAHGETVSQGGRAQEHKKNDTEQEELLRERQGYNHNHSKDILNRDALSGQNNVHL